MLTRIDHIGIAVRSIAEARRFYEEALGLVCEGEEEVPEQRVRVAFFRIGEVRIELLEPMDGQGPVATFLERRGEGFHHLAYATDGIAADMERAGAAGARLINEEPIRGAGGRLAAFLHPASAGGVLTELCAQPEDR